MPRKRKALELTWEVEVCAFSLAIVLARIQPNILSSVKDGILHKFTAQELINYCSSLNWCFDMDFRVGLGELMHGIHLFNYGTNKVLETYFHVTVEDDKYHGVLQVQPSP